MKVLFLGMGGIGQRHAANIRRLRPDADLFAVRDRQNDAMTDLSVRCVPTLDDALTEKPDAAVVALPPALHAAAAKSLVDADVPFYLEKPVATRVSDIEETATTAESKGLTTMVGCLLRMAPGFQRLRQIVVDEEYGPVRHVQLSVGQWLPSWRPGRDYRDACSAKETLGGGVILELIHEVDLVRFLFGEYTVVASQAGFSGTLEIDTEDYADILLRGDGPPVSIHLDYLDRAPHRSGRVVCDRGTIVYNAVEQELKAFDAEQEVWRPLVDGVPFAGPEALFRSMEHFMNCRDRGAATNQPLAEGVRSLALAEAAKNLSGIAT